MKKSLSILILLISIFLLFTACNNETETPEKEPLHVTELDINDEIVQTVYNSIWLAERCVVRNYVENFYQAKTISFNDLSNMYVLGAIINNSNILPDYRYFYYDEQAEGFEMFIDDGTITGYTGEEIMFLKVFIIPIENFDEKLHKMFSSDALINYPDSYTIGMAAILSYTRDSYLYYLFPGGGDGPPECSSYLVKAEADGEYLYLYDKYAYITYCYDCEYEMHEKALYADCNETVLLYEIPEHNFYKEPGKTTHQEAFYGWFGEYMQPYKHTFKKAEDGSYYWVSTEMISEIPEN